MASVYYNLAAAVAVAAVVVDVIVAAVTEAMMIFETADEGKVNGTEGEGMANGIEDLEIVCEEETVVRVTVNEANETEAVLAMAIVNAVVEYGTVVEAVVTVILNKASEVEIEVELVEGDDE